MAHALETDPINQLKENLLCSVCLGTLKDPRTLPCFHSFCRDCLEGVVKTCRDEAPRDQPAIREFHCPDCRVEFTLDPDKHIADMPRNHFICNMVQATAILDRETRIPCSHTNCSKGCSVARCVTCEKFLCHACLAGHKNYRANEDHSVLSMEELSKPENRKKIQGKMYCDEHSGEILKVYCETCDQLICKDCMDFQHLKQNHSCFLVKDVVNNYKELITSNNNAFENDMKEGNAFLEGISLLTEQLDNDAENTKRRIVNNKDAVAKKIVEMLEQKADMLLNEVEQAHEVQRARLDRKTEETKYYLENIRQSVQLSKTLVEQGTEEEIISSQRMMLDSGNNLLAKRPEFSTSIKSSSASYGSEEQFNEEVLRTLVNSLGWVIKDDKGNQDNESNLNPTPVTTFTTSENHPSSTPVSCSNAVTDEATEEKATEEKVTEEKATEEKATEEKATEEKATEEKDQNCPLAADLKGSSHDTCQICLRDFTDKKTLDKCGHSFCSGCIDEAFKHQKKCPVCLQDYGPLIGNQPSGKMLINYSLTSVVGYETCGSIAITYTLQSGVQGPDHPNPRKKYQGTVRTAYLPDNKKGRKVLRLLERAFKQRLTFTIGQSKTSGRDNVIIWNGIHHKTSMTGGPANYGYPDPDYLKRVQNDLAAKGITE